MKKVRYAAGALGVLGVLPALGVVTPAPTAATTTPATAAPAGKAKTVSLLPVDSGAGGLTRNCNAHSAFAGGGASDASISPMSYSKDIGCAGKLHALYLNHTSTGVWMRVREYVNGVMAYSRFNKNGHILPGDLSFSSHPFHTAVTQVCIAFVRSTAPGTVLPHGGPVCAQTGFP
jgi:hypothetical protein